MFSVLFLDLRDRLWGAGVVFLWWCFLSTNTCGGGGLFIVQASVRGPLLCHSAPPGVDKVLQHPYNGDQGVANGLHVLPDPQIVFLLQPLGLLKRQYRYQLLLGMMHGGLYRQWNTTVERPLRGFMGRDGVGVFLLA
ncbi:hypothetical protein NDU88_007238 [Pleurodeles waltl]|uniref:Secreted protein n=1 Tax=Pleurodeles waltl TaxID=8319 RepID=A0AAV7UQG5_PLEWA|nr:hypothetical protein NDU88_007238 [Pleurodeles waltl]